MKKTGFWMLALLLVGWWAVAPAAAQFRSVYHDPWLNWDFWNWTGQPVNDLDVVVENPNYNPGANWWSVPFNALAVTNNVDGNGDGNPDTILTYSGAVILPPANPANPQPNEVAHGGIYTLGAGPVVSAYWTNNGQPVGPALAITYEQTEVRLGNSAEIHMLLNIAPQYFEENPGKEVGWTNIRTFRNIPASLLGLEDLNRDLPSSPKWTQLLPYEVVPKIGNPGLGTSIVPILPTDIVLAGGPDSFFDVFIDLVDDSFLGSAWESLLIAEVVELTPGNPPLPLGMFWNLNPQSPEPVSVVLFALGLLLLLPGRGGLHRD